MSTMTLEIPDALSPQEVDGRYIVEYTFHQGHRTAEKIRRAPEQVDARPTREERLEAARRFIAGASGILPPDTTEEEIRQGRLDYLSAKHLR